MSPPPVPPAEFTSEVPQVIVSVLNEEAADEADVIVVAATATLPPPPTAIASSTRPRSSSTSSSSSCTKSTKSGEGEGGEKEWANKRLLVSLGMLLPALAAIIGKCVNTLLVTLKLLENTRIECV